MKIFLITACNKLFHICLFWPKLFCGVNNKVSIWIFQPVSDREFLWSFDHFNRILLIDNFVFYILVTFSIFKIPLKMQTRNSKLPSDFHAITMHFLATHKSNERNIFWALPNCVSISLSPNKQIWWSNGKCTPRSFVMSGKSCQNLLSFVHNQEQWRI